MGCGHLDAEIALVVLEANVVTRLVLLDQVVFEDQRFLVAGGHQRFDVFDPADQKLNLRALVGVAEVGAHPRAQVFRLADIDHLAGFVAHQIDARARRHVGPFFARDAHRLGLILRPARPKIIVPTSAHLCASLHVFGALNQILCKCFCKTPANDLPAHGTAFE